jgi:hypothetical protein
VTDRGLARTLQQPLSLLICFRVFRLFRGFSEFRLLKHCGVELIALDEFHHLFAVDRAKVMTKASQWLKVLIVNTGLPVVVCGMPEA